MKTSVLMSVYEKENPEFLKLALESIYDKQTMKPDEIVVVFDGALTDELYKVLDDFRCGKEDVVFYYPQEINRGLGQALSIGAKKCTGDYIFRMDTDDISLPQRFEKQLAYIEEHPDIDVLGASISEFDFSPDEENKKQRICPEKHEDIVKMSKSRNPMNHMTVCIKREALERAGGYEPLFLMEDYYLWLRMIVSGCKLANLSESLVNVRVGNGFISRRSSTARIASWRKLQKFMIEHELINKAEAAINMVYIVGFVYCPVGLKKLVYSKLLRK